MFISADIDSAPPHVDCASHNSDVSNSGKEARVAPTLAAGAFRPARGRLARESRHPARKARRTRAETEQHLIAHGASAMILDPGGHKRRLRQAQEIETLRRDAAETGAEREASLRATIEREQLALDLSKLKSGADERRDLTDLLDRIAAAGKITAVVLGDADGLALAASAGAPAIYMRPPAPVSEGRRCSPDCPGSDRRRAPCRFRPEGVRAARAESP
jgi:hypothetical protein